MEYSFRNMTFFGVPPYWFWAGIGFLTAITCYMFLLFVHQHHVHDHIPMLGYGAIGLAIGAKLFGCITKMFVLVQSGMPITLNSIASSGIVFYGGLLGFISFILLAYYALQRKIPWQVIDLLAICIPLFHTFARLGCFFGGCCYGKLSDGPFAVYYEVNQIEAAYRIPVQLFESCGCLVIFFLLFVLHRKEKHQNLLLGIYLFTYAILRFFLEFLRGDIERGVWQGISFSQVISVVIIGTLLLHVKKRRQT